MTASFQVTYGRLPPIMGSCQAEYAQEEVLKIVSTKTSLFTLDKLETFMEDTRKGWFSQRSVVLSFAGQPLLYQLYMTPACSSRQVLSVIRVGLSNLPSKIQRLITKTLSNENDVNSTIYGVDGVVIAGVREVVRAFWNDSNLSQMTLVFQNGGPALTQWHWIKCSSR